MERIYFVLIYLHIFFPTPPWGFKISSRKG
jgi:hypothetical protein